MEVTHLCFVGSLQNLAIALLKVHRMVGCTFVIRKLLGFHLKKLMIMTIMTQRKNVFPFAKPFSPVLKFQTKLSDAFITPCGTFVLFEKKEMGKGNFVGLRQIGVKSCIVLPWVSV